MTVEQKILKICDDVITLVDNLYIQITRKYFDNLTLEELYRLNNELNSFSLTGYEFIINRKKLKLIPTIINSSINFIDSITHNKVQDDRIIIIEDYIYQVRNIINNNICLVKCINKISTLLQLRSQVEEIKQKINQEKNKMILLSQSESIFESVTKIIRC